MSKSFDYEKIFMGVTEDRSEGFQIRVLREDYRLRRLIEVIPALKGRMLDIGCGGGTLTECLPYYYPRMKIFGCDISTTAISYAKKYGKGKVRYSVIQNNILPYRNNSIDVVICLDVLEHVPNIHLFLKEIKRVLKKNGLLYLAVPCEGQPFTFTWFFQKIKIGQNLTFKHVGHIHPEFTHDYIIKLLNDNKLLLIKKSYSDHLFYQFITLFEYFLAKELLEFFLGSKKAEQYYDRSIVGQNNKKNRRKDLLMYLRIIWFKFWKLIGIVINWERELLKNVSFTAWKFFILTRNIK